MSRDSEKAIKAAMKYLSENATGNESEEELNDLLKEFILRTDRIQFKHYIEQTKSLLVVIHIFIILLIRIRL